jgi:hypothetical protein
MVLFIHKAKPECAGDVRAQEEKDEFAPVVVWEAIVEEYAWR